MRCLADKFSNLTQTNSQQSLVLHPTFPTQIPPFRIDECRRLHPIRQMSVRSSYRRLTYRPQSHKSVKLSPEKDSAVARAPSINDLLYASGLAHQTTDLCPQHRHCDSLNQKLYCCLTSSAIRCATKPICKAKQGYVFTRIENMNVLDEIVDGYGEFDDCPACLAFDISY